jgi:hypothetical protein
VVPYQRLGLYLGFAACLCGGIGGGWLAARLHAKGTWATPCLVAVVLALLIATKTEYRELAFVHQVQRPSPDIRAVTDWIRARYAPSTRVFSHWEIAMFVEPLTGLRVDPLSFDFGLLGRGHSHFHCDGPWDLVIGGETHCTTYGEVFRSGPVIVSERVSEAPPTGSASGSGPG